MEGFAMNKLIMYVYKQEDFIRFTEKNGKYVIEMQDYTCEFDSYQKARSVFETFLKNF